MDLEFILAAVPAIEPLYIDAVLGNFRLIPGTKTQNSIRDGSFKAIKHKVRVAAWKRASFKTKMRVASLRAKVAYWNFRHRCLYMFTLVARSKRHK